MSKARWAIVVLLLILVLLVGLLVGAKFSELAASRAGSKLSNTSVLLQQVQTLSQLVTVKYVLEKVVVLEDAKWYGENRIILVAHGIVKAGVDLQKLQPGDVRVVGHKKISLSLPPPAIIDVHLDDEKTQVVERSTGLLREFDKDLEQSARRQALGSLRSAAHRYGILKEAEDRLRDQLTVVFQQLGFEEVEIRLVSPGRR